MHTSALRQRRSLFLGLALVGALLPATALAGLVALAQSPLTTATTSSVKPNILFVLDDSKSMDSAYMPDEANSTNSYGYSSSQCNGVAYNPAKVYTPPVQADGTSFPNASFFAASSNGFSPAGNSTATTTTSTSTLIIAKAIQNVTVANTAGFTGNSTVLIASTAQPANWMIGTVLRSSGTLLYLTITDIGGSGTFSSWTVTLLGGTNLSGSSYYRYTGVEKPLGWTYDAKGVITTTNFYKECTSNVGSTPGSGVFTQVTMTGSSPDAQNYANWYSYYRTRLLMMKSAMSLAFKAVGNRFRVGYTTISDTGAADGASFLNIAPFDIAGDSSCGKGISQKSCFYSRMFAATTNGYTPLRGALSKAGRIFAGKLGTDPVEYSCQQNFTLMSTDGYWNTSAEIPANTDFSTSPTPCTYGPCKLDGTAVSQQDGSAGPPYNDGQITTTTTTTPWTWTETQTLTETKTTTQTLSQNRYYLNACPGNGNGQANGIGNGNGNAKGVSQEVLQQEQLATQTTTAPVTITQDVTWTRVDTVVTITGKAPQTTAGTATASAPFNVKTVTGTAGTPVVGTWADNVNKPPTQYAACQSPAPAMPAGPSAATPVGVPVDSYSSPTLTQSTKTAEVPGTSTSSTSVIPGVPNTLADVAYYYYLGPLRSAGLTNCTSGSATGANLCPAKPNVPPSPTDPNQFQHMVTYTFGLGVNGVLNYTTSNYANDTAGDYFNIKNGTANWPNPDPANTSTSVITRIDDLWHAAVNGHGTYYSARDSDAVVNSLREALQKIDSDTGYGTAAAASTLAPVAGNNFIYVSNFVTGDWTGNLQALTIDPVTRTVSKSATWCVENIVADPLANVSACPGKLASQVAAGTRKIYAFQSGAVNNLRSFAWANLSAAEQAWFDPGKLNQWATLTAEDRAWATGANLIAYLRGGPGSYTNLAGATVKVFRSRSATLGDIVDSQPVYLGKPYFGFTDPGYAAFKNANASRGGTIYVGANDGMLHAFDATDGSERWAYVPGTVMPNLYRLADTNYASNHMYSADGAPGLFDVCAANCADANLAEWHTILVAGLSAGGRGYYALDVTDPTTPKGLWEFTSANDSDLGYSYGMPLAVKKSDGTWVILVTSGYNNVTPGTGQGFLYALNPMTGAVISKISTGAGDAATPSGLARISAFADNPIQNATALYVYGGDLLGNIWRFDINALNNIKVATLSDSLGNVQPITTRPELGTIGGNRVVLVGTGKYLEASDLDSANFKTQTVYGIKDSGTAAGTVVCGGSGSPLVQQTITNTTSAAGQQIRTVSANAVDFTTVLGWCANLPDPGELVNVDPVLVMGTLLVATNVPTSGVCTPSGYSWLNYFNYGTGSYVPGASYLGFVVGNDITTGINLESFNGRPQVYRTGSESQTKDAGGPDIPPDTPIVQGHRVSWRELISPK